MLTPTHNVKEHTQGHARRLKWLVRGALLALAVGVVVAPPQPVRASVAVLLLTVMLTLAAWYLAGGGKETDSAR
jgi:hypothetical protein